MFHRLERLIESVTSRALQSDSAAAALWLQTMRHLRGFDVQSFSPGNKVEARRAATRDVKIVMMGGNNRVVIRDGASVSRLDAHIVGSDNVVEIGERVTLDGLFLWITGNGSRFGLGADCFFQNGTVYISEHSGKVEVGRDCLVAGGTVLRCGDGHTLHDAVTGEILNRASYIKIEDHVWLTSDVLILKDVTVATGSVVASRAVVTKNVPANSLVAGIPAKILRSGVNWRRENIDRLPADWFSATMPDFSDP